MRIGRLIRMAGGRTVVATGATCASACVLIFAAGLSRVVDIDFDSIRDSIRADSLPPKGLVTRLRVGENRLAKIGIHRPALAEAPAETSLAAVKSAAQRVETDLRRYAAEMNLSPRLIDDMLTTPPEQVKWLSEQDLQNYGLGFLDPVYVETVSIVESKRYNITASEYRRRNSAALTACVSSLSADDRLGILDGIHRSDCTKDIISGGKPSDPLAGAVDIPNPLRK
jgi:hypothetical protein